MYSLLTEPGTRLSLVRSGLLPQARPLQGDAVPDGFWSFLVLQVKHRSNWLNEVFYTIRHPLQIPNGTMFGRYFSIKGSVLLIRNRLQEV